MFHKSVSSIFLFVFLGAVLFLFPGCETSDINNQESVTSGTSTGSGSSGGAAANVIIYAGNNSIGSGATTSITVITTDSAGSRTDTEIILNSSRGGYFNGSSTNTTLNAKTANGIYNATYTAPTLATGASPIETEITVLVMGTVIRGSTTITISLN